MIGRTNTIGGSLGKAFARIIISFPYGQSSCTDGTTTLQGTNNGFTVFNVPNAGTWTATITDGTYTTTKSFLISENSVLFSEMAYLLPTGYKQIEYVDVGNGEAYTAVDVSAANITSSSVNSIFVMRIYLRSHITAYYDNIGGASGAISLWRTQLQNTNAIFYHGSTSETLKFSVSSGIYTYIHNIWDGYDHISVGGTASGSDQFNIEGNNPSNVKYLGVGRSVNYTTGDSNSTGFNGYVYSFELSYQGTTYVNLLPCTNPNGIAGFWDKITQQFYKSLTTTDFIAGPEVEDSIIS